jgi:hypothetical protein
MPYMICRSSTPDISEIIFSQSSQDCASSSLPTLPSAASVSVASRSHE